jgi:hypothetical protein
MKRLLNGVEISDHAARVLHPMDIITSVIRHGRPMPPMPLAPDETVAESVYRALKSDHRIVVRTDLVHHQTLVTVLDPA